MLLLLMIVLLYSMYTVRFLAEKKGTYVKRKNNSQQLNTQRALSFPPLGGPDEKDACTTMSDLGGGRKIEYMNRMESQNKTPNPCNRNQKDDDFLRTPSFDRLDGNDKFLQSIYLPCVPFAKHGHKSTINAVLFYFSHPQEIPCFPIRHLGVFLSCWNLCSRCSCFG